MTLSWLGLVQEIAGPLRHRLLPQCPPDGEYRDDLICRKDAHTSSSPAAQDATGGRIVLLPRPLPKVPSGRTREVAAEEIRALAPAPSGGGEGKPLGAWLPLASGPILRSAASAGQPAQPRRVRRTRASASRASRQVLEPYEGEELVPRQRPEPSSRLGRGSRQGGRSPT